MSEFSENLIFVEGPVNYLSVSLVTISIAASPHDRERIQIGRLKTRPRGPT